MNLESILFFNTRRHRQKRTMPHPDLSIPLLPDAEHDLPLPHPRPHPQYTWPEAGPSSPSGTSSVSSVEQPRRADGGDERMHTDTDVSKAGIFGAKAIAAMTGAMATSLLSTSCVFPPCLHISLQLIDTCGLVTPFDVLKTRLQTVPPHLHPSFAPASGPIPPSSTPIAINSPAAAADCCQTTSGTSIKPQHPLVCTHSSSISIPPLANHNANHNVRLSPPSGCLNPSKWAGIWGEPIPSIPSGIPAGRGGAGAGVLVLRQGPGIALRESSNIGVGDLLSSMKSSTSGTVSAGIEIGSSTSTGGFWKEVAAVRAESGIRGLWKGVGTAM